MTLFDVLVTLGLFAGLAFITVAYTYTERGSTLFSDTHRANRRSRWWMRKGWWAAHWPHVVLIVAYTIGYGFVVAAVM